MLVVEQVKDPVRIASAVHDIYNRFAADAVLYKNHPIGTPGGGWRQTLLWIPALGIWGGSSPNKERFHDVIFGNSNPENGKLLVPTVKASLAVNGGRHTGGLIVRDHAGLLLAHSGRIGGGKSGNNKTEFRRKYNGPKCLVQWESGREWYAIIGRIADPNFLEQVADFIKFVNHFKEGKTHLWRFKNDDFESFIPETGSASKRVGTSVERTHQDIVNALYSELEKINKTGKMKIVNDTLRDLMYLSQNNRGILFEIKTAIDRQSIYTAIGQLLFNRLTNGTGMILVAPNLLSNDLQVLVKLNNLGISFVGYERIGKNIKFKNLRKHAMHCLGAAR